MVTLYLTIAEAGKGSSESLELGDKWLDETLKEGRD